MAKSPGETLETLATTATLNRLKTQIQDLRKAQRIAASNGDMDKAGRIGKRIDAAETMQQRAAAASRKSTGGQYTDKKTGKTYKKLNILSKKERAIANVKFDSLADAKRRQKVVLGQRAIKPNATGLEASKRRAQMNKLTGGQTAKRTPGNAQQTRAINKQTKKQLAANAKRAETNAKKTPEQRAASAAKGASTRRQKRVNPNFNPQGFANALNNAQEPQAAKNTRSRKVNPNFKGF